MMTTSSTISMHFKSIYLLGVCSFLCLNIQAQDLSNNIHIDQFGYLIDAEKVAVISNPQTGYNNSDSYSPGTEIEVRNFLDNSVVLTVAPQVWNNGNTHSQSGDAGWWVDFSEITTPGSYYLIDPSTNEQTGRFEINENPYAEVLKASLKAFYYNRCNDSKEAPFAQANWIDGNNFPQDTEARDAYDQDNAATARDMSGGWFDAGDYNKYVTFAHDPIHQMLTSYTENPSIFTDDWNIPESGDGIPDILNEIKWELDWMRKMINDDGSVHIKMGSVSYSDNFDAPPSANVDARYYGSTCSSASLAVASCFAHAALVFKGIEGLEGYAAQLTLNAISCFDYYETYINNDSYETDCDDGLVKSGDADWNIEVQKDNTVIACSYLFKLTNENKYSEIFTTLGIQTEILSEDFIPLHASVMLEALLHYTTTTGANLNMVDEICSSIKIAQGNDWGNYFHFEGENLYRAGAADWAYYWGSNRAVANVGNLCNTIIKYNILPDENEELRKKATELVHYFHGVNPQGITYLSNMYQYGGDRCANQIYHTWFNDGTDWDDAITSAYGPAPGFLAGGPNQAYSGNLSPPANQPIQKAYLDYNSGFPNVSWEITEPAIYYQAAYLRLLANYVNTSIVSSNENQSLVRGEIELFPNPTNDLLNISGDIEQHKINVYNTQGQLLNSKIATTNEISFDVKSFQSGVLIISVYNSNGVLVKTERVVVE